MKFLKECYIISFHKPSNNVEKETMMNPGRLGDLSPLISLMPITLLPSQCLSINDLFAKSIEEKCNLSTLGHYVS
jgi:hypothetical protein